MSHPFSHESAASLSSRGSDRVKVRSDKSVNLESTVAHVMVTARSNAHLASNAFWDGAQWRRYDTAAPASMLVVGAAQVIAYEAPAGANPITWAPQLAWAAPAYGANWSAWGGAESTPGYRKDLDGRVSLEGLVTKSTALVANDVIFNLPSGYRPAKKKRFSCASFAGYTCVAVAVDGNVVVEGGGGNTWISLDGISFDPAH